MRLAGLVVGACGLVGSVAAQTVPMAQLPVPMAPAVAEASGLRIVRDAVAARPFSVVGPRGALLGTQSGVMEGWIFPWKVFSGLRMSVKMADYPVPIDVNEAAASVDVQPDHTTITYGHANFTIRQVMFAPAASPSADGVGVAAYFEVEAVRPLELTISFTPEMKRIWPAVTAGGGSPDWVATKGGSGFYVMRLDLPGPGIAMAMPGAEPGVTAPYQESPKEYPTQFVLHVDPKRDAGKVYPLLMAVGETEATSTNDALHAKLLAEDAGLAESVAATRARYAAFVAGHTAIETPDKELDAAFQWAEVAIDQLRVDTIASPGKAAGAEQALVAGFFSSGDSARPGFGWFFGRDALWTLYAVNSYGDFKLSRDEMEFLLSRQRADGKILHEYSQAAELVDWKSLPYEWAAADATPLLLMEMEDYRAVSGDKAFVEAHWAELAKAWQFVMTHDADGDGVYDNSQGTAWVESWPPGMPKQELYLAAIDAQASTAFAKLARATGHAELAAQAEAKAAELKKTIEREYYLPATKSYAFSYEGAGKTDESATIFPTVAWWDGTYALDRAGPMLSRWASSEFSTDWGTRDLSPQSPFYDPISYHQGTVWPLYTGWASLAQYRAGRPLAGYAALMQNAGLTWVGDLGDVTELLSGEFFRPLGRSTSHQLWSSAMVISPVLRGMFGIGWDAAAGTMTVAPHLPASWDHAVVRQVPIGAGKTDLTYERVGGEMVVRATGGVKLTSAMAGARSSGAEVRVPLPAVEVGMTSHLPMAGAVTQQMKVLDQVEGARSLTLQLSGMGGAREEMLVRRNKAGLAVRVEGGMVTGGGALGTMAVEFPAGTGYVEKTVRLSW